MYDKKKKKKKINFKYVVDFIIKYNSKIIIMSFYMIVVRNKLIIKIIFIYYF